MAYVPAQVAARDAVEARLRGEKADWSGTAFTVTLIGCLVLVLVTLVALLWNVLSEGVPYIADRGLFDFLSRFTSSNPELAGVYQAVAGTIQMGIIIMVVSFPLGVATALYLEEYATDNLFTRVVEVVIRNLAGVPAIVYGLLGAVPASLREGGFGAGGTRWEVTRTLVLPNAMPGILTGTILGLARGLGEAAPLLLIGAKGYFTGGEYGDITGNFTSLPYIISDWTKLPANRGWGHNAAAAIVVTLVVILGINAAGIFLRNRFEKTR